MFFVYTMLVIRKEVCLYAGAQWLKIVSVRGWWVSVMFVNFRFFLCLPWMWALKVFISKMVYFVQTQSGTCPSMITNTSDIFLVTQRSEYLKFWITMCSLCPYTVNVLVTVTLKIGYLLVDIATSLHRSLNSFHLQLTLSVLIQWRLNDAFIYAVFKVDYCSFLFFTLSRSLSLSLSLSPSLSLYLSPPLPPSLPPFLPLHFCCMFVCYLYCSRLKYSLQ